MLNRRPDVPRDIRNAVVEAVRDTDHYQVLICFGSNDVRITLYDAIQIQQLREPSCEELQIAEALASNLPQIAPESN